MTSKKILVLIIIFLTTLSIWIYVSIHNKQRGGSNLISPQNFLRSISKPAKPTSTPTPTIIPTPTPIILEVEKLTPKDFSQDFETLKKSF